MSSLSLLGAASAQAQSCRGLPSLASTSKVVSLSASTTGLNDNFVTARFGVNGRHLFGGALVGYATRQADFLEPNASRYGVDIGYAFRLGGTRDVDLCPILESVYQAGARFGGSDKTSLITSFGLSLGRNVQVARRFAVVPYVEAGLLQRHHNYSYSDSDTQRAFDGRTHADKLVATSTLGSGLALGNSVTITPSVTVPMGAGHAGMRFYDTSFGHQPFFAIKGSFSIPR